MDFSLGFFIRLFGSFINENQIRMIRYITWLVRRVVTWPSTQNGQKTKVVALHCSFQNLFELCSEVLPLWRYDVKDFEKRRIFFCFCIFLHENKTKQHDFTTFGKLKERATIIVSWEKWPKKEGACPKWETDTDRLQSLPTDYKRPQNTKFTDRVQKKTTKVGLRLQNLLTDYKRLQKLDLDYKV